MDEDTRTFLQHIHDSLEVRMATKEDLAALQRRLDATATRDDLAALRAATREDLAGLRTAVMDLRNSTLHYSSHVEMLLKDFAGSQRELAAEIDELKRRVAALEERLPPQAAA